VCRVQQLTGDLELEVRAQLLRLVVRLQNRGAGVEDLADGQHLGKLGVQEEAVVAQPGVRLRRILLGLAILDQVLDRVEAKTVDPLAQPKARDLQRQVGDRRVAVVEVRQSFPEEAVVILVADRRLVPNRLPRRSRITGIDRRPDVPVAVRR
jgi:hypothetical protein